MDSSSNNESFFSESIASPTKASTAAQLLLRDNNNDGESATATAQPKPTRAKRICRFPGCTKQIKQQGHCQRHGANVRLCKVPDCTKQAQTGHDQMCKHHWKEVNNKGKKEGEGDKDIADDQEPATPLYPSVYDTIIPLSAMWREGQNAKTKSAHRNKNNESTGQNESISTDSISSSTPKSDMPLVEFLRSGSTKEPGWHRKEERLLRNPEKPVKSLTECFQPEEKQLILFETMLLSGTVYYSTNKNQHTINTYLAHAWGRNEGFNKDMVTQLCERRGDLIRKKRSDMGRVKSEEHKTK